MNIHRNANTFPKRICGVVFCTLEAPHSTEAHENLEFVLNSFFIHELSEWGKGLHKGRVVGESSVTQKQGNPTTPCYGSLLLGCAPWTACLQVLLHHEETLGTTPQIEGTTQVVKLKSQPGNATHGWHLRWESWLRRSSLSKGFACHLTTLATHMVSVSYPSNFTHVLLSSFSLVTSWEVNPRATCDLRSHLEGHLSPFVAPQLRPSASWAEVIRLLQSMQPDATQLRFLSYPEKIPSWLK